MVPVYPIFTEVAAAAATVVLIVTGLQPVETAGPIGHLYVPAATEFIVQFNPEETPLKAK
jgi:hypothetical protein